MSEAGQRSRGEDAADSDEDGEWVERVREKRAEKDDFFATHPQSPVPPAARDEFDGLSYYEPDPAYRVEATVERHDPADPVTLDITEGMPVRYLHVVTFHCTVDGRDVELAGLQRADEAVVFVPFSDATTGEETYEHGRYLELTPDRELESGDEVTLDFNLAYNPFCAYSETFACPLPPASNELDVAVQAGERRPDVSTGE